MINSGSDCFECTVTEMAFFAWIIVFSLSESLLETQSIIHAPGVSNGQDKVSTPGQLPCFCQVCDLALLYEYQTCTAAYNGQL